MTNVFAHFIHFTRLRSSIICPLKETVSYEFQILFHRNKHVSVLLCSLLSLHEKHLSRITLHFAHFFFHLQMWNQRRRQEQRAHNQLVYFICHGKKQSLIECECNWFMIRDSCGEFRVFVLHKGASSTTVDSCHRIRFLAWAMSFVYVRIFDNEKIKQIIFLFLHWSNFHQLLFAEPAKICGTQDKDTWNATLWEYLI